jgi:hypothetical protein
MAIVKDDKSMRQTLFLIVFISIIGLAFSKQDPELGQLRLLNAHIVSTDTVQEDICGFKTKAVRIKITAKTRVQMSCNFGDPSQNIYDTVANTIHLCYAHDTTNEIRKVVLREIEYYITETEAWATRYNNGKDFSFLPFNKSFFVSEGHIVPFIWTGSERAGDYQVFYLNNRVYKIILIEGNGFGSLSSFTQQNMYFIENGRRIQLGKYIKNTDDARVALSKN